MQLKDVPALAGTVLPCARRSKACALLSVLPNRRIIVCRPLSSLHQRGPPLAGYVYRPEHERAGAGPRRLSEVIAAS